VQRTELGGQHREDLQAGEPGGLPGGVQVEVAAHLAGHDGAVRTHRAGPGEVHQVADLHRRDVPAHGRERFGQRDAEAAESSVDRGH
jgi:hypothetical protein